MQGKMAIVGDPATITVFKAAGVDAFPADEKNVRETLRRVARDYSVIFLTEEYATRQPIPSCCPSLRGKIRATARPF